MAAMIGQYSSAPVDPFRAGAGAASGGGSFGGGGPDTGGGLGGGVGSMGGGQSRSM
jgi:hypothetical protein